MHAEGTVTNQLDFACRLADALIESSTIEALALVEELELPTGVFMVGEQTPHVANAAWRKLDGDARIFDAHIDEAVRTGAPIHVPQLRFDQGRPAYLAATLRPSRSFAGTHVTVVCTDITDDVIARRLAVDANALVWSGPLGGAVDYLNHRFAPATSWEQLIHDEDLAKCTKGLASAVAERGSIDLEARVRRGGDFRWQHVRFTVIDSRWFGSASDVHQAHEATAARNELLARIVDAKADADKASRLKDQFLAVVSHELRTPLTTIVLWEGVLRDNTTDPVLRAKALEAIRQSALSQSRVVGDLLDVSRAIAGKLHIDLRSVEIGRVVREAIQSFAPAALEKQIVIDHRDTTSNAQVEGDAIRLRQVLDNLLSNALKFTGAGGRITVAVAPRGRSISIEVSDTGQGVAAELLPALFDPFRQSDDVTTRGAGGLGLGLAIVQQLVGLHGGTVVASSAGLGHGTTLTVTLPASPVRHLSAPPVAVARVPDLARTRVLVIDDDQRVREALAVLLDRAGAVVETADSAETARTRIANGPADVIVCDIAMPNEDGYSFIRGLRAARNGVAAIALTAYASQADVNRALAAGFDRHLAKPIDFERLVENIDELAHGANR